LADGWLPVGMPFDVIATMWTAVLQMAEQHGRPADALRMVLRADPKFTDVALGPDRFPFVGSPQQVRDDIERAREIGTAELILDLHGCTRSTAELIDTAVELSGDLARVG
jgi:alkanesulfonate monooxygenase SsuD/methylene tetrahydromethanopterin reductase-like flavin-dependent oxidoreductase (luciferase family)